MNEKKKGLGKGLSNLLPDISTDEKDNFNTEYQYIDLHKIIPNPDQPRKHISEKELNELAETIKNVGIIEPKKEGDKFMIISGERRWRAAQIVGFKKIPAIIKNHVDEIKKLEMAIIENIQREDLNPIEEARSYERLVQLTNLTIKEIGVKVGKDRSTISNLLRLLKLPEEIQQLLVEKKISVGQARPLLSITDKKMMIHLANKITNENWSSRKVEEEVAKLTETKKVKEKDSFKDPSILEIEKKIRAKFSTKAEIQHHSNGNGKIILHYANLDEFDRILGELGIES